MRYVVLRTRTVTAVPDDDAVLCADMAEARDTVQALNAQWQTPDGIAKAWHSIHELGDRVNWYTGEAS